MTSFAAGSKSTFQDEDEDIFEDSSFFKNFEGELNEPTTSNSVNTNVNKSVNNSTLNISALCCDEEISGYDKITGKTWIYPTNYPVRDYQFNIIKASMVKNTLVSLPTGLGKTFIAAVIMYNFYRWYPLGKIIFTAPTRPLVAQQIEACYNICAIPSDDTIEMTGTMPVRARKLHWKSKRVFFATPQVIYNDIKAGICPAKLIKCLVLDEAHRARGNYAYCQIISSLNDMGHRTYRVLALSATPGSKLDDVIKVVNSLNIAHLELRTEHCIDVAPYSHVRKINTVIIQLGPELTQLRQQYTEILDVYARRLKHLNILPQNVGNLSKGRIVMLYKEYQAKTRTARHAQHNYIMRDFTILIALFHGLELLVKHGSRVFLNFFDEHPEKAWIQTDDRLIALLERLRDDLGTNPLSLDRSMLPDGTIPEIPKNLQFGHPKFNRLKEIMLEHFTKAKQNGQDTRAIVFCEYRESVNLVHCLLLQCRPLIKPQMFVGQGGSGKDGKSWVSQKQQLRAMRAFRAGESTALVATCVAEEGLDVGAVDLILCFDISTRSPIRLVQRCGRTGRGREGQVYILVTEGREHQTLLDSMRQRDGLNKKVMQSKEIQSNMYKLNPRMIPHDYMPDCLKMFITVTEKPESKANSSKKSKKGQKDLRDMILARTSSSSTTSNTSNKEVDSIITKEQFDDIFPEGYNDNYNFPELKEYFALDKDTVKAVNDNECSTNNLASWLEWQRTLQSTANIGHSSDTNILCDLLQYSDTKRFDLPSSSQNPSYPTQMLSTQNLQLPSPVKNKGPKRKKVISTLSPVKKDGDIRALFSTATKSTKGYTKVLNELGLQNEYNISTTIIDLLVALRIDNNTKPVESKCSLCENSLNCQVVKGIRKCEMEKPKKPLSFLIHPTLPDISLLNEIDSKSIKDYKFYKICDTQENTSHVLNHHGTIQNQSSFNIESTINESTKLNQNVDFDLGFEFDSDDSFEPSVDKSVKKSDNDFDIGDIDDIFCGSSPEESVEKDNNLSSPKETLKFFGLDSIDDIFADSDDSVQEIATVNKSPKASIVCESNIEANDHIEPPCSPSILSGRKSKTDLIMSPIIGSQARACTTKVNKSISDISIKRKLFTDIDNNNYFKQTPTRTCHTKQFQNSDLAESSKSKSMFTVTQLVEMINSNDCSKYVSKLNEEDNNIDANDRSMSPIILTQADRRIISEQHKPSKSLDETTTRSSIIILESDDDDEVNINNIQEDREQNMTSPVEDTSFHNKRKERDDDDISGSPYFHKKQKLCNVDNKTVSLQKRVKSLLSLNKNANMSWNSDAHVNYVFEKENLKPKSNNISSTDDNVNKEEKQINFKENIKNIQIFRRNSKSLTPKSKTLLNGHRITENHKAAERKLSSDTEFTDDDFESSKISTKIRDSNLKGKVKKKRKENEFLDLEADITDCSSGDELSDDSVGSIIDFICDDNVPSERDIHSHYLQSVRSPVKGIFKIPELPTMRDNVFSQIDIEEENDYEIDSFCVDSHIGLTQANDISELELAEMRLEQKRRNKKRTRSQIDNSPVLVGNKKRNRIRQINSDSDDSS